MDLTDKQWELIEQHVVEPPRRTDGKGRPRVPAREVLNGVLWILRTGAPWKDMPGRYPPYQTCHRRFQEWRRNGTLRSVLEALAEDLLERGKLKLDETFIDGSFSGAKKGALQLVQRSAERGPRSWQSQTAMVFLSPSGLRALRHMRRSSSKPPSTLDSSTRSRSG